MPLELNLKCKARLIEAVAAAIPKLNVEYGRYIDRYPALLELKTAEAVLPDKGPLRERVTNYIDFESPLTEFILDSITEELQQFPYEEERSLRALSSMASYGDSQSTAVRLIEKFDALPSKCTFSLKLPSTFSPIMGPRTKIELSPQLRIVKSGPELSSLYPPEMTVDAGQAQTAGLLGGLAAVFNPPATWESDSSYLQIDVLGFVGFYGGTNPHLEAVRIIRAFCGLGLALRLFEMKSEYSSFTPPNQLHIHRKNSDDRFEFYRTASLDDNVSRAMNGLTLDTFDGMLDSESTQQAWSDRQFESMRAVFAGGKKAEALLLASQWFFDSHSHGSDQLLKYIQTTVVLEILLGDKASSDQTGLGILLGNRCAYLIGRSQEDRADVLNTFTEIYGIRSQIVHRGKHRLSYSERILFHKLRWMCRRVLSREIELLRADKKDKPLLG
jgi:hypothetical protein